MAGRWEGAAEGAEDPVPDAEAPAEAVAQRCRPICPGPLWVVALLALLVCPRSLVACWRLLVQHCKPPLRGKLPVRYLCARHMCKTHVQDKCASQRAHMASS